MLGKLASCRASGRGRASRTRIEGLNLNPCLEASGSPGPVGPGVALSLLPPPFSLLPPSLVPPPSLPPFSLLPPLSLPPPSHLLPPSSPPSQNGNCFFPGCLELVSSQGNNVSPQLRQTLPPGISLQWRNTPLASRAVQAVRRWDTPRACLGTSQRGTRPETHRCKQKQKQKRAGKTQGGGYPQDQVLVPTLHLPVSLEQIISFSEPVFSPP